MPRPCHPERSEAASKDLSAGRDQGSGLGVQGFLTEPAYGKLNLSLDVLGKRPDGYHDLRMVMCSVELHDDVEIALGAGQNGCTMVEAVETSLACPRRSASRPCDKYELPQGAQNLAFRAASAYFAAAGIAPGGCFIRIAKRIPTQAGMAGGSSDAAAVLRALNRHYGAFSDEQLREIGLTLGSDVPYCLFGGVALAEGRGERLTRLPDLPEGMLFVLAKPDFSISTPALFRALDEATGIGDQRSGIRKSMPEAITAGDPAAIGKALSNDFAPVLSREHPVVESVKQQMIEAGALGSELTGTGSVIYGLFDDASAAEKAAIALRQQTSFFTAVTSATRFYQSFSVAQCQRNSR